MRTIVVVHGGVDAPSTASYQKTVELAAVAGATPTGGSALDAVEAAIKIMETDPDFNAGAGSALNRDGYVEMDAMIIDGDIGSVGAVAAIQEVEHPISVARRVLEATPYVLIAGEGATAFAREQGFPVFDCVTTRQREIWQTVREKGSREAAGISLFTGQPGTTRAPDTVGCVVLLGDRTAAGVSTGGMFFKAPGRVGDSPIMGAGGCASKAGAVAATGHGEASIEISLCRRAEQLLQRGVAAQEAVEDCIRYMAEERNGVAGLIAVDRLGRIGIAHNGDSFPVAVVIDGELQRFEAVRLSTG